MKVYILDSRIDIGQPINVGSGKFGKKNKLLFWSLEYVTKVIQIKINIFHISALINFKSSTNFSFGIKKLVRSLQKIMGSAQPKKMAKKENLWYPKVINHNL